MDSNKAWYLECRQLFLHDVAKMLGSMTSFEPELSTLQAKDCVFRQNRDIRFSANKDPYKTNFAAYFSIGGKKSRGPGYYVHLEPGKSFIAGGIWMPDAEVLKKIRQEIDYTGEELREIMKNPSFISKFKGLDGEKLKTNPKGFDSNHPFIDLIRFKSFIVSHSIADVAIDDGGYREIALTGFRTMKPFQDYLRRALDNAEGGQGLLG